MVKNKKNASIVYKNLTKTRLRQLQLSTADDPISELINLARALGYEDPCYYDEEVACLLQWKSEVEVHGDGRQFNADGWGRRKKESRKEASRKVVKQLQSMMQRPLGVSQPRAEAREDSEQVKGRRRPSPDSWCICPACNVTMVVKNSRVHFDSKEHTDVEDKMNLLLSQVSADPIKYAHPLRNLFL